ncbi:hypothetical protein T03_10394 [Trichinella britovi]|uniref:Uncharacterized protein n=1 Tax=Trichinella britovi TaxID=45882 RepID=A0A0V0YUP6_TRIBR|nr:hypothetical protein T03_10394 [Trichinella britovi]
MSTSEEAAQVVPRTNATVYKSLFISRGVVTFNFSP